MAYFFGALFRTYMINFDKRRQRKQVFPDEVLDYSNVLENVDYIGKNNKYQFLDIVIPKCIENNTSPVIIDFHGGAYYHGEKLINKFYVKYLAKESNMRVVNANYRLIKKGVTIFDQVQDVLDVISYIYANAEKYNIDKNNIFITGDSAGAHVVALAINAIYNLEYKKELGFKINENIKINAVGLTCGVYSFNGFKDMWYLKPFMKDIIDKKYKKNGRDKYANVYKFYNHKCPVFISSSNEDFLKDQSLQAYKFFEDNNVECEFVFLEKSEFENRKLEHVYNILYPDYVESLNTNKAFCDFVKKHIK